MKKFAILTLLGVCLLVLAAGCSSNQPEFNGNLTGNDTQFLMDYTVLSRTETHEMPLVEGASVDVKIENTSGRLDILVTDADGETLYQGDDVDSGQFSLIIPKTSTYTFTVTGDKAKGSVSFIAAGQ